MGAQNTCCETFVTEAKAAKFRESSVTLAEAGEPDKVDRATLERLQRSPLAHAMGTEPPASLVPPSWIKGAAPGFERRAGAPLLRKQH